MRRPYKYPYLTVFILGYYWLEHEGYYYKIRNWLGYGKIDEPTFVLPLVPETLGKLASAPDRQVLLLTATGASDEVDSEMRKAAKKAKERKRSPVLFGRLDCSACPDYCAQKGFGPTAKVTYLRGGVAVDSFDGPFAKDRILKFLKKAQQSPQSP